MPVIKKVNLYSSNDLRANLDENLFSVFEALGYKENFNLIDVRLALNVVLSIIAAGAFYIDKKTEFKETFDVMVLLIGVYFAISGVLFVWTKFVEKNIKFVGFKNINNNGNEKIVVKTRSEKTKPVYFIELEVSKSGNTSGVNNIVKTQIEFTKLFNENGFLEYDEFKQFLKVELEKVTKKSI